MCESCTVRAVLGRELVDTQDAQLLALERMRLLDMAHSWARNTHASYQSKLQVLQTFAAQYSLPLFQPPAWAHPRHDVDIVLMWCQEASSLSEGSPRLGRANTMAFGSIRQLRSALAHLLAWNSSQQPSPPGYLDRNRRLVHQACRLTDALPSQLHSQGLSIRLGTESSPSKALLDRHVRFLLDELERAYAIADPHLPPVDVCMGAVATLFLWLGWLRGSEVFGLRWCDLELVPPKRGPLYDLPTGIGMIILRLLPETKSQRTAAADVILAYETISGYQPGLWVQRLKAAMPQGHHGPASLSPVFLTARGGPWTSSYYRTAFLYPSLGRQQANGDPALRITRPIQQVFWSLHSFRNGARSQVSRRRLTGATYTRKATTMEVYEHGRWRRRRSGELIDIVYNQWPHYDRIQLTLCCM